MSAVSRFYLPSRAANGLIYCLSRCWRRLGASRRYRQAEPPAAAESHRPPIPNGSEAERSAKAASSPSHVGGQRSGCWSEPCVCSWPKTGRRRPLKSPPISTVGPGEHTPRGANPFGRAEHQVEGPVTHHHLWYFPIGGGAAFPRRKTFASAVRVFQGCCGRRGGLPALGRVGRSGLIDPAYRSTRGVGCSRKARLGGPV